MGWIERRLGLDQGSGVDHWAPRALGLTPVAKAIMLTDFRIGRGNLVRIESYYREPVHEHHHRPSRQRTIEG